MMAAYTHIGHAVAFDGVALVVRTMVVDMGTELVGSMVAVVHTGLVAFAVDSRNRDEGNGFDVAVVVAGHTTVVELVLERCKLVWQVHHR